MGQTSIHFLGVGDDNKLLRRLHLRSCRFYPRFKPSEVDPSNLGQRSATRIHQIPLPNHRLPPTIPASNGLSLGQSRVPFQQLSLLLRLPASNSGKIANLLPHLLLGILPSLQPLLVEGTLSLNQY